MKKIKILVNGYPSEITIGEITREQADFLLANPQDCGHEVLLSEDGEATDWYELDDVDHIFGGTVEDSYLTVYEDNEQVLEENFSDMDLFVKDEEDPTEYENPVECTYNYLELDPDKCYIISNTSEKGNFIEMDVEDENFDIKKLKVNITSLDDYGFNNYISSIEYDGDGYNIGGDTIGKDFQQFLYIDGELNEIEL